MTDNQSRTVLTTCVLVVHSHGCSPNSSTRARVQEISEGRRADRLSRHHNGIGEVSTECRRVECGEGRMQ